MSRMWTAVLKLAGATTTACAMLCAQSTRIEDLAAGKLLVMERKSADPVFGQSVILLIFYNADGVVGLRLNQLAGIPLSRLSELQGSNSRSDPIHVGGPVELAGITALVRSPGPPPDGIHVAADLYAVQTKHGIEAALKTSKGSDDFRIYLGYCGWVIPQLQNEVKRGSWHIFDHGEDFAFDSAPATLWKRLIERAELKVAFAPVLKIP